MTQTKSKQIIDLAVGTTTRMLFVAMCMISLSVGLAAQETVVGSDSTEGSATTSEATEDKSAPLVKKQTSDKGKYDVKSSFEIGVRGRDINGNENKYRSDLNYRSGVRLFDSSVLITAKDSGGEPFDTFLATGSGWGADPNGYARFNVEKVGYYQFDSSIRRFSYFNNLTNFALNQHNKNTKRNLGDFDVTIFPQSDFRFRAGYSFNNNSGPGLLTYDHDRDEFPIDSQTETNAHDFRVGVDGKLLGFNFSFTEGYRQFDDETSYSIDTLQLGNNPNPNASLSMLSRVMPERGSVNYHSFTFNRTFEKKVDVTGRLIYSESKSRFNMLETFSGTDRSGNVVVLNQSDIAGDAKRPNLVGDIGITLFVTDSFSISNTFSANSYRITGSNVLLETLISTTAGGNPRPTSTTNDSVYRFTNFRRYINTIEANFDVNRYISFYGGYRYANRRVILDHVDIDLTDGSRTFGSEAAKNNTNTFLAGFRANPILKKWTLWVDLEHGESDNSFTRLGNADLTNFRVRNRIRPTSELSFNLSFQMKDNSSPGRPSVMLPTAFVADSKSRNISASFDWAPNEMATVSGGFTHNRLDSETSVIFPVTGASGQGLSRYKLRSNFGHVDVWLRPQKRISFFGSYRITKDTGQGDFFSAANFTIDGNYPISFQSPEARFSVRVNRNIDLNVGYQYYKFEEKILNSQNYSAHLPYASVRIYFGRDDR